MIIAQGTINQFPQRPQLLCYNVNSVEVTLATNNTTTEAHSAIEVSIDTTNVTTYSASTSNNSISVGIVDSVKPEISISSTQHDGIVTEGGSFTFTLTADPVPYSAIMVDITAVDASTGHLSSLAASDSSSITVASDGSAQVEIGTSGTAQVSVTTTNDTANVRHGVIDISIDSVTNTVYTVVADPEDETDTLLNAIQVKIKDTVKPVISIATNSSKVSEGNNFIFSLSADPTPIAPISVDITVAELVATGHLSTLIGPNSSAIALASDGSTEVEIGTSGSVDVAVATINDATNKRHGEIKVSLVAGTYTDYAITTNTSQQVVEVKVEDQIAPEISVSSTKDDSSISEGESFKFTVTADIVPLATISVNLAISDNSSGHFKSVSPTVPIAMLNVNSVEVTLATNDTTTEAHSAIEVSIDTTNVTTYSASTSNNSISVGIVDSVKPEISISSTQHDGIVTEGGSFNFTLTADPVPYSAIMVDITAVDASSGHLSSLTASDSSSITVASDGSAQVEIGTSGTAQVTVSVTNDTTNVRHGVIDISIDSVTNAVYTVVADPEDETDTLLSAIQVKIKDLIVPKISINSVKDGQSVTEGESFIFTLNTDLAPLSPIEINLDIENDTGHFSQITPSAPIVLHNVKSKNITLSTYITDTVKHGEILISINDTNVTTYSKSPTNNSIMVRIKDSHISIVSIDSESNNGVVTEGENFEFTISTIPAPLEPIFVEFTAVDVGLTGHLGSLSSTSPVEIGANGFTRITVSTHLDAQNFRHGEIRIALSAINNKNYKIASEDNSKSIRILVKDRENPVVSITSNMDGQSIVEGGTFYFSLMVKPVPVVPILVALNIDDGDLGYFGSLSIDTPVKLDGSNPVEVVLFTRIVSVVNEPGNINVQIGSAQSNEYEVSQANRSVNVLIEKDIKSIVSITAHNQNLTAIEGESFRFSLHASPLPRIPIRVSLTANDGGTGHFARFLGPEQILVNTGGYGDGEISTRNISDKIGHGIITVTINPDPTYQISRTSSSIRIIILDNIESNVPEVSVKANPDSLVNSDHAQFIFTAIPAPLDEIKVEILVNQQGGAVRWRVPKTIMMMSERKTVSIPINMAINSTSNPKISVMVVDQPHYIANSDVAEMTISNSSVILAQGDQTRIAVASHVADVVLQIQNDTILEPEVSQSEISSLVTPIVSISVVADSIQEGQTAQFRLSSTQQIFNSIFIRVEQLGNFLNSTPPTQYSLNGENEGILELPTIDNQIAEPDGKITVSINQGHGYSLAESSASASVIVTDNADRKARQEQIALNIEQLVLQIDQAESELLDDTITNRIQSFSNDANNSHFKLGGQQNMKSLIIETGETINSNDILVRRLLDQSSFEFNIDTESDFMNSISVWGKSNFRNLNTVSNEIGDIGIGELFNGQLGFDTEIVPELVAGLGTIFTRTSVNLDSSFLGDIEFQTNSTQFNPYIGWKSAAGSSEIRSVIGIGFGDIVTNQSGYESSTFDSELYSFTLGGRVNLLRDQEKTGVDIAGLTNLKNIIVRGGEDTNQNIEMMNRFSRIGLEGIHNFDQIDGVMLTPKSSIGIVETNISGQSLLLSEVAGGIGYTSSFGLGFNGEGQIYTNQIGQIYEWKLRGSLSYDRNQDNLGLVMTVDSEHCSKCATNSESLFGASSSLISRQVRLEDDNIRFDTNQISTEISYGIEIGDEIGQLNPFVGVEYSGNEITQRQIGGRVSTISNIEFELVGTHDSKLGFNEDYSLKFNGFFNW